MTNIEKVMRDVAEQTVAVSAGAVIGGLLTRDVRLAFIYGYTAGFSVDLITRLGWSHGMEGDSVYRVAFATGMGGVAGQLASRFIF